MRLEQTRKARNAALFSAENLTSAEIDKTIEEEKARKHKADIAKDPNLKAQVDLDDSDDDEEKAARVTQAESDRSRHARVCGTDAESVDDESLAAIIMSSSDDGDVRPAMGR